MLKRAAEFLLARGGPAALASRMRRGSTLILAYHNVLPAGAEPVGDRSLHLPLARFRAQLDRLAQTHDVVDFAAIRTEPVRRSRPRAAITFDDAYRGALSNALPELVQRGMPATVFVAPGLLGSTGCWWDRLTAAERPGLDPTVRDHVLEALRGDGAAAEDWASASGMPFASLPAHAGIATEQELRAAASLPGIRFGSHTWSHGNLARLEGPTLDRELAAPLGWLRERFEDVVPWLAYPYGLSGPSTSGRARAAGYDGALRIIGGWVSRGDAGGYVLPRLNVPAGLSGDGYVLRVSGLLDR